MFEDLCFEYIKQDCAAKTLRLVRLETRPWAWSHGDFIFQKEGYLLEVVLFFCFCLLLLLLLFLLFYACVAFPCFSLLLCESFFFSRFAAGVVLGLFFLPCLLLGFLLRIDSLS